MVFNFRPKENEKGNHDSKPQNTNRASGKLFVEIPPPNVSDSNPKSSDSNPKSSEPLLGQRFFTDSYSTEETPSTTKDSTVANSGALEKSPSPDPVPGGGSSSGIPLYANTSYQNTNLNGNLDEHHV